MIRNIMNGAWKIDDTSDSTKGLNYWWGMSAGIIDVICSQHLPIGTARLVDLLKKSICEMNYNPFSGVLYSQSGIVQKNADALWIRKRSSPWTGLLRMSSVIFQRWKI